MNAIHPFREGNGRTQLTFSRFWPGMSACHSMPKCWIVNVSSRP
ncbi:MULTISPECIES: hypothetical protein [Rhizobium]|nr:MULTISPECIES: hypothetical protein [Rhizobium]WSH10347.1 hypothetical protein U8P72_05735 [Rhizobium johnstonii]WSH46550.1 hypothetical protein U8P77_05765 [Rhizobium johnstonii]